MGIHKLVFVTDIEHERTYSDARRHGHRSLAECLVRLKVRCKVSCSDILHLAQPAASYEDVYCHITGRSRRKLSMLCSKV